MAESRQGPLVIGVLTAITGSVLFLAAGDVLPVADKTFGAPRWLVSLFALGVFFGGGYLVALAYRRRGCDACSGAPPPSRSSAWRRAS